MKHQNVHGAAPAAEGVAYAAEVVVYRVFELPPRLLVEEVCGKVPLSLSGHCVQGEVRIGNVDPQCRFPVVDPAPVGKREVLPPASKGLAEGALLLQLVRHGGDLLAGDVLLDVALELIDAGPRHVLVVGHGGTDPLRLPLQVVLRHEVAGKDQAVPLGIRLIGLGETLFEQARGGVKEIVAHAAVVADRQEEGG